MPSVPPRVVSLEHEPCFGFVIRMQSPPDNRFGPSFVAEFNAALDAVEKHRSEFPKMPCALLTVSNCDGFFSNGLDLAYLFSSGDKYFICDQFLKLLLRLMTFPVATVAAISGHAYAGGLLFALCHDYRVMSNDPKSCRLCMNEIELPSSLHEGMAAILAAKLNPTTIVAMTLEARRFDGPAAKEHSIIDELVSAEAVNERAAALAERLARRTQRATPAIIADMKEKLFAKAICSLRVRQEIDVRLFMAATRSGLKTKV